MMLRLTKARFRFTETSVKLAFTGARCGLLEENSSAGMRVEEVAASLVVVLDSGACVSIETVFAVSKKKTIISNHLNT